MSHGGLLMPTMSEERAKTVMCPYFWRLGGPVVDVVDPDWLPAGPLR